MPIVVAGRYCSQGPIEFFDGNLVFVNCTLQSLDLCILRFDLFDMCCQIALEAFFLVGESLL